MFKRIDHIEIIPGNLEKSISFYTGILGFKIKLRQKVEVPEIKDPDGLSIELRQW